MGGQSFLLTVWSGDLLQVSFWQRGVGCDGGQGSYLTARKLSWEQNGLPPIVNIMQITPD